LSAIGHALRAANSLAIATAPGHPYGQDSEETMMSMKMLMAGVAAAALSCAAIQPAALASDRPGDTAQETEGETVIVFDGQNLAERLGKLGREFEEFKITVNRNGDRTVIFDGRDVSATLDEQSLKDLKNLNVTITTAESGDVSVNIRGSEGDKDRVIVRVSEIEAAAEAFADSMKALGKTLEAVVVVENEPETEQER
jgi:hypothetical protein